MKRNCFSAIITVGFLFTGVAYAADYKYLKSGRCEDFKGEHINAMSFDSLISLYGKIPPKDEFESTEQYSNRMKSITENTGNLFLISKQIEGTEFIPYDADNKRLLVKSYALHNTTFDAWSALNGSKTPSIPVSSIYNIDTVISQQDKIIGSHSAQNAYGAQVTVTKILRSIKAIYQGPSRRGEKLFKNIDSEAVIGFIPAEPENAKNLRSDLKVAFVISPKPPFIVRSQYHGPTPTINNPKELKYDTTTIIADIKCGLLYDKDSMVIAAFSANGSR